MNTLNDAIRELQFVHLSLVPRREVMATAWRLAKRVAAEFKISSKLLFAKALKLVWAKAKVKVSIFDAYDFRRELKIGGFTFNKENKAWECEMALGEFRRPSPVQYGRGFIHLDSAFEKKHNLVFLAA